MSFPPDRNSSGDDDGSGWREPEHLGGDGSEDEPNVADRRRQPRDDQPADRDAWQPPGWELPAAGPRGPEGAEGSGQGPGRGSGEGPGEAPPPPMTAEPTLARGGLFGSPRRPRDPEMARAFTYEGDLVGVQGWALQNGWTVSDGSAPQDAVLRELVTSAPVRASKDHRPASVLRGRAGNLELVAFDVVYASGRYLVAEYAVTAAPVLGAVPGFRLSPARFWKHRTGGLLPIASGNELFDTRWLLLAAEDTPQIHRLVGDATVQALLLGTDDGDEFWSAAGHVAAIRPDGHRPQLLEHHARLLTAIVAALSAGYGVDPVV
jgi:hypothetical protein